MLIKLTDDVFINTEQVNYIKGFKDLLDGRNKTCVCFTNKDAIYLPIAVNEITKIFNDYIAREEV